MIAEDFLEEVVPEPSLKGCVGISQAEVTGLSLGEETDGMKAQRHEAAEATGHLKLKVRHSRSKKKEESDEGETEGRR